MQVAEQRIQLAEAQAKAVATQDGPQIDFSADMERQMEQMEAIAAETAGRAIPDMGRLHVRSPLRPVPLSALLRLPETK